MKKPITLLVTGLLSVGAVLGLAQAANATQVPTTTYDAVLWQTSTYNVKYPQVKKTVTNETTLTLPTIPTTCGTSYQADVYVHTDAETSWLNSTTSLAGPDGAQDGNYLAPGGQGVAYNYVVNAVCPPVPPASQVCTVTGSAYAESGDNFAVKTATGYQLTAAGGKATDLIFPASGNIQGFTSLTYTDKNVVGNGIFFRFIFDLSADGGSAYNSFSVSGSNTINQSSVAGVGSKAALLGKTLAQVATAYPHNKFVGVAFETGSAYAAGDGALLTGYSGACGAMSFVDGVTPPTQPKAPTGIQTGDTPLNPLVPAGILLLLAGGAFAARRKFATK